MLLFFSVKSPTKNRPLWLALVTLVAVILSFILVLPRSFYGTMGVGLDYSWQIALELAIREKFVFGRDFIFTYGPLGILTTRLPFEGATLKLVLSDLFVYGNLSFILFNVWKNTRSVFTPLILISIFYILGTARFYLELPLILALYTLYFGLRYERSCSGFDLLMALISAILAFYIKLNTGLISFAVIFLFFVSANFGSRSYLRFFLSSAVVLLSIGVSSYLFSVDLIGYIVASGHIANGYNDAAYLDQPDKIHYVKWALGIIGVYSIILLSAAFKIIKSVPNFVHVIAVSLNLFVIFKQGFVRADEHVFAFFEYVPALFGVWLIFIDQSFKKRFALVTITSLILSGMAKDLNFRSNILNEKFTGFERYLDQFNNIETRNFPVDIPANAKLPESFLKVIGNSTVDIIPHEISLLYFNGLKYNPRPVMQSYLAYDGYLDGLNADKYISNSAPEFVIFSLSCIDDRYCFFDETKVKEALLKWYSTVDVVGDKILLKRKSMPSWKTKQLLYSGHAKLGERIKIISGTNILSLTSDVDYSFFGKILRTFYKPPPLTIRFLTDSGWSKRYRLIVPIVKSGVIINPIVNDLSSAKDFFDRNFEKMDKIREIKINSKSKWAYKENFYYAVTEKIFK